jgi:DNA polymerase-3 subunit epsilon
MRLPLDRPIVFFDLETTGTDIVNDRIVQLAVLKIFPDGARDDRTRLVNPGVPIPAEATAVHGVTDEQVAAQPAFPQVARSLHEFFSGCDIAGFNSNRFDLPLLAEEFARCGIEFPAPDTRLIDVQTIYHRKEERTLSAAYRFYCGKTLDGAHDAGSDVRATAEVFAAQLERYGDLGSTVAEVHQFCNPQSVVDHGRYLTRNTEDVVVFNFGKHKGEPVLSEREYAEWMLESEFPATTKLVLRRILSSVSSRPTSE